MGPLRITEAQRTAVMQAYQSTRRASKDTASSYFAAIDALHGCYPDLSRQVIAQEAVRIITSDVRFVEIVRNRR